MKTLWRLVSTGLAASLWLTLAWVAWQGQSITVSSLLVGAQYTLTAVRLVWRAEARRAASAWPALLASASALLPLALRPQPSATNAPIGLALQWAGLALTVWALWSLGRSFGLAPADRGLVNHGPYRWVRHPAYLGELLALAGFVWVNPSLWNLALWLVIAAALLLRLLAEERLVAGYALYAANVRWRLCPGVW